MLWTKLKKKIFLIKLFGKHFITKITTILNTLHDLFQDKVNFISEVVFYF